MVEQGRNGAGPQVSVAEARGGVQLPDPQVRVAGRHRPGFRRVRHTSPSVQTPRIPPRLIPQHSQSPPPGHSRRQARPPAPTKVGDGRLNPLLPSPPCSHPASSSYPRSSSAL